jgi:hypothetical protein
VTSKDRPTKIAEIIKNKGLYASPSEQQTIARIRKIKMEE